MNFVVKMLQRKRKLLHITSGNTFGVCQKQLQPSSRMHVYDSYEAVFTLITWLQMAPNKKL